MPPTVERTTIYRYGAAAWAWRLLVVPGVVAGAAGILFGVREASASLVFIGVVLLAPALFFGVVLATRVDLLADGRLEVWTLLFLRRRVHRDRLGTPRVREGYEADHGPIHAPRAWVPVRGRPPIYLDLLAGIPDRRTFADALRMPASSVPRSRRVR